MTFIKRTRVQVTVCRGVTSGAWIIRIGDEEFLTWATSKELVVESARRLCNVLWRAHMVTCELVEKNGRGQIMERSTYGRDPEESPG